MARQGEELRALPSAERLNPRNLGGSGECGSSPPEPEQEPAGDAGSAAAAPETDLIVSEPRSNSGTGRTISKIAFLDGGRSEAELFYRF